MDQVTTFLLAIGITAGSAGAYFLIYYLRESSLRDREKVDESTKSSDMKEEESKPMPMQDRPINKELLDKLSDGRIVLDSCFAKFETFIVLSKAFPMYHRPVFNNDGDIIARFFYADKRLPHSWVCSDFEISPMPSSPVIPVDMFFKPNAEVDTGVPKKA